jgi:predicted short-subunit dehydrogenase-like oxidoreductase (DUF2520 family)
MTKVCIIGLGRLGSHLYYAINRTGKFKVSYVVKNSKVKIDPVKLSKCEIIFICTGDSDIQKAVKELRNSKYNLKGIYIFHTSGAHHSGLLSALERKGAFTGSFHPVQTFESRVTSRNTKFWNIYIAIEGSAQALIKGAEIVKSLGSKSIVINKEDKTLHHINSVFASNYLVVFLSLLEGVSQKLSTTYKGKKIFKNGFNKSSFFNIYKPLIEQTLRNIEIKGFASSLTGPIERNDVNTIRLHLKTLKIRMPELLPFYIIMGTEAVKIAQKKGSLKTQEAKKMIKELNKFFQRKNKN